jgi:hypothetical protein
MLCFTPDGYDSEGRAFVYEQPPRMPELMPYAARMWDCGAGEAIVSACVAHPTLQELSLDHHPASADAVAARAGAGTALGRLVAANVPALHTLSLRHSRLGDIGVTSMFDALARNTHLLTLQMENADVSDELARTRVLAAARANESLRTLGLWEGECVRKGMHHAEHSWAAAAEVASQRQRADWGL